MKLNNAQKVLLKFVAISQLYVALAVLVLVVYGAARLSQVRKEKNYVC